MRETVNPSQKKEAFLFPVRICIRGIDRHHLLSDVVACITEKAESIHLAAQHCVR